MAIGWMNGILSADQTRKLVTIARFVWMGMAAAVVLSTVLMVVRAHLPIPMMDEWDEPTAADHLAKLFVPHNEHVIFFPRLIFLIDKWLFSGSHAFEQFTTLAIELTHATLLAWLAGRARLPAVFRGFVFIALFWAYPMTNFILGFQVQFVGVFAAATAAFAVLAFRRESGLVWAVFLGFVATLTMANGMLVGLLLAPLAYCLLVPRRHVVLAAAAGLAMIATYFLCRHLYAVPHHAGAKLGLATLDHIGMAASYFGVYLGAPIGRLIFRSSEMSNASLFGAAVIGYAGVALLAVSAATAYRRSQFQQEPALLVLISVALFIIGTAMLTALGRAVEFPLYTAATGRYGTPALIFWVVNLLAAGNVKLSEKRWIAALPGVAAGLLGVVIAVSQPFIMQAVIASPGMSPSEARGQEQYLFPRHLADRIGALTAVLSGVDDEAAFHSLYLLHDHQLLARAARLRAVNVAPFDEDWTKWLGDPLPASIQRSGISCRGRLDTLILLARGGWRVGGTLDEPRPQSDRVILLSDKGFVVGYGLRSPGRTLREALLNNNSRWQGHVSGTASGQVTAYALDLHRNAVCALGQIELGTDP